MTRDGKVRPRQAMPGSMEPATPKGRFPTGSLILREKMKEFWVAWTISCSASRHHACDHRPDRRAGTSDAQALSGADMNPAPARR